jgi:uncharacterized protein (DUF2267 family)
VRGIYFEAWRPARTPEKLHTKEEFIGGVAHKLRPHPIAAEAAVRDVFALLAHHCDPGEIADVVDQLPTEIKELWPETACSYRSTTFTRISPVNRDQNHQERRRRRRS